MLQNKKLNQLIFTVSSKVVRTKNTINMHKIVLLLSTIVIATSCITSSIHTKIEIIKPPVLNLDSTTQRVIINSTLDKKSIKRLQFKDIDTSFYFYPSMEFFKGFKSEIEYNSNIKVMIPKTPYETAIHNKVLDYGTIEQIDSVMSSHKASVIIDIKNIITRVMETKFSDDLFYYGSMEVKNLYTSYVFMNKKKYSVNNLKEKPLYWNSHNKSEAKMRAELPDTTSAIFMTSEMEGRKLAKFFMPSWTKVYRKIIVIGNNDMRLAGVYAKKNKWEAARKIWQHYSDSNNKNIRRACKFNTAVYHEVNGELLKAFKIVKELYEKRPNSDIKTYMQQISSRLTSKRKLSKSLIQTPSNQQ